MGMNVYYSSLSEQFQDILLQVSSMEAHIAWFFLHWLKFYLRFGDIFNEGKGSSSKYS